MIPLMKTQIIEVRTGGRETIRDITAECARFAEAAADGGDGLLPADDRWRHAHGSRGHGRSHVLPAFVPPYATLPVIGGRLALGTWQSVVLVDLNVDNPNRQIRLSFLS